MRKLIKIAFAIFPKSQAELQNIHNAEIYIFFDAYRLRPCLPGLTHWWAHVARAKLSHFQEQPGSLTWKNVYSVVFSNIPPSSGLQETGAWSLVNILQPLVDFYSSCLPSNFLSPSSCVVDMTFSRLQGCSLVTYSPVRYCHCPFSSHC